MIGKPDAIDFKTQNLSRIGVSQPKKEKAPLQLEEAKKEDLDLLQLCQDFWDSQNDYRTRRKRARDYYRGKQLEDLIEDPDNRGEAITEREYIISQGKVPLKQNVIRQLVKNVIGQYRLNPAKTQVLSYSKDNAKTAEMLTNAIQAVAIMNKGKEKDARNYEEFLLSGAAIQKVYYGFIPERDREDVLYKNVNPNRLIINTDIEDVGGDDINLIGEIIDTTIERIIATFAKTPAQEKKIREYYSRYGDQ